jgi:hypothetical protein
MPARRERLARSGQANMESADSSACATLAIVAPPTEVGIDETLFRPTRQEL